MGTRNIDNQLLFVYIHGNITNLNLGVNSQNQSKSQKTALPVAGVPLAISTFLLAKEIEKIEAEL